MNKGSKEGSRSSVVRMSVFGRQTFSALRQTCGWQMNTVSVNSPIWV